MTGIRDDARRAVAARRERALSAPAPTAVPVAVTVAVCVVAAVVLFGLGFASATVAIIVAVLALAAGVAARRTTLSLLAGLVLALIRPYRPGERVLIRDHDEPVEATVVRLGAVNSILATSSGWLVVANARLLRRAPGVR